MITPPTFLTAGSNFLLEGQVEDANDPSRNFSGPVDITIFFEGNSSEVLISSFTTTVNGKFSTSLVPTDPAGDGLSSGNKTLVVGVLEGSSPFYLPSNLTQNVLVKGVTDLQRRLH